jgi:hypothetical protein
MKEELMMKSRTSKKSNNINLISYGINKKIKRIEASTISIQKCSKQYDSECH